jgi:hypothetical protein
VNHRLGNCSKLTVKDCRGYIAVRFGRQEAVNRPLMLLRVERGRACEFELNSAVLKIASTCGKGTCRDTERNYQRGYQLGDERRDPHGRDWLLGCD